MSEHAKQDSLLTRRNWLVLAASVVSGCGGGSSSTTAGLPGTGGTGYTQGSISGFGSVIVNGIKFDDTAATVQIDGGPATSLDLRLGMVAGVQGKRLADPTLGTASRIEVWSIAQGPVLQVPLVKRTQRADGSFAESAEFSVAGMTVQTDPSTSFYGVAAASALVPNQVVTVWGLQAGTDDARWTATCVVVRPMGMDMVSTGLVNGTDSKPLLNGLLLTGSMAETLTVGSLLRVQGAWSPASNSLAMTHTKLLGSGLVAQPPADDEIEVEIEGVVTDTPTARGFMLGNIRVDASAMPPLSSLIQKGTRLEVYGTWQSAVLKAAKVKIESQQALEQVEIEARIEQFTNRADFVVRMQRCDATGATISPSTEAALKVGVKVKLKGTKAGDVLLVTELEIDD